MLKQTINDTAVHAMFLGNLIFLSTVCISKPSSAVSFDFVVRLGAEQLGGHGFTARCRQFIHRNLPF